MSASTTVLATVFDDDGRCIGFVLKRRLTGYEAFAAAERSGGIFENERRAANALLMNEGGA